MGKLSVETKWFTVENEPEVFSPSLLIYPDRIEENIRRMVTIAGGPGRLRPHVKTHKMDEVVKLQMKYGISKFKCATISEAEMVAGCGARDVMLAMQPVGPNIDRFFRLKMKFGDANISCIADSGHIIKQMSDMSVQLNLKTDVWLDINVGMDRTGIQPGEDAVKLFGLTGSFPGLKAAGLHVYDGHIHEKDPVLRRNKCIESYIPVQRMIGEINSFVSEEVRVVAGGSPTFPVHASREDVELSPGTILLWDWGYSSSFSDMDFLHAAVLIARIVSVPSEDLFCLDLGHKAVGSEMAQPRIKLTGLDDYSIMGHNEEHMVIRTQSHHKLRTGDVLYAIPWHICPTVDRYDKVYVVRDRRVTEEWDVSARRRQITI